MSLIQDGLLLFKREMLIFKTHLLSNIIRSIIFPLVLILFLGGIGNSVTHIPIAVVNYANNPQSIHFISDLQLNKVLNIVSITTQAQAMEMLHSSNISLAIIILPNFPNTATGPSVSVYYTNNNFENSQVGLSFIQTTASSFSTQKPIQNTKSNSNIVSSNPVSAVKANYKDFLFGGILIMVVIFGSTFNGGISLIKDRDLGILKYFLMAPISKISIILGKIFSSVVQSSIYVFITILIGFADGVTIAMGPLGILWIFAFTIPISILFSCVAIIFALRIPRVEVFTIIMNAITLPLWFLSGAIFPSTSLPAIFQSLNIYNPITYAVDGIRGATMLGYLTPHAILVDLGVIFIGIIIMFILAVKLFKSTID